MSWQPGQQPMMGGQRIEQRLADLERQLAELKRAISVSPGEVVIKSQGGVKIEAQGETLIRSPATVRIEASILTLPGGSKPIVRIGDIATGGPGAATITGPGNPRVMG